MKSPKKMKATAGERQLQRQSVAQYADYVARFRPAEIALAKKAELTGGERAQVKGEVSGDVASAFKGLSRSTVSSSGQAGADVSSGKTKFGLAADATAAGEAKGLGQAVAIAGAEIDETQQKIGITAIGRDLAHDATANLSQGARRATSLALAASQARFETNLATTNAAFAVAGAATKRFGQEFKLRKSKANVAGMRKDVSGLSLPKVDLSVPEHVFDFPDMGFGV